MINPTDTSNLNTRVLPEARTGTTRSVYRDRGNRTDSCRRWK